MQPNQSRNESPLGPRQQRLADKFSKDRFGKETNVGRDLAKKYSQIKKKNRECSLYGWVEKSNGSEEFVRKLCDSMVKDLKQSYKQTVHTKRVYIMTMRSQNEYSGYSDSTDIIHIQSQESTIGQVSEQELKERTILIYED